MTEFLSINKNPKSESVKVVVRSRPMTEKEISNGYKQIVEMNTDQGIIELHPPNSTKSSINSSNLNASTFNSSSLITSSIQSNEKSTNAVGSNNTNETIKQFTFDAVFDCNAKQSDIYDEIMRPIVDSVLEGFNGTIFAYGQTGTGKTYTMAGDENNKGIIPNSFSHIFNHIARTSDKQYLVRASYLEIYQEEIRDLLIKDQNKRLELKERADTGVYVKDLSSFVCKSIKEIEHVMYIGNQNRSVGSTNMNEHSSRSHAIFIITIEHSDIIRSTINGEKSIERSKLKSKSENEGECDQSSTDEMFIKEDSLKLNESTSKQLKDDLPITGHIRVGKLNLVDLAGSERQYKTGTVGIRQKEAIKINLSLSALGNVISALVDSKTTHIPYRASRVLTRILQDSLGGNSKTVMIANIGPANYNYEETMTTLRYASRAKNIKNKPRVNEDPKDALLKQFQLEIERLKMLLTQRKKSGVQRNRSALSTMSNEDSMSGSLTGELSNSDFEKLAEKIKQMESKLLCGGRNIVDHTNEQQRELERKAQLIAAQKQKEREIRQKLEEQQENTYEIKETFTSLQQEIELKKRKLKKLFFKLQLIKSEINDTEEANARDRRDLEECQNDLMRELKFKYLVIENFIPLEEKNKLLSRIYYDEDVEDWRFMNTALINSGARKQEHLKQINSARFQAQSNRNQELSSSLSTSMISNNLTNSNLKNLPITLRFKIDNNLILNLIEPIQTVKQYKMPSLSPTIKAAIDSALDVDSEILIDASPNRPDWPKSSLKSARYSQNGFARGKQNDSLKDNSTSNNLVDQTVSEIKYPKALGLIKR